ncbi:hypothetical protein RKD56_000135 [Priestia megaterium]
MKYRRRTEENTNQSSIYVCFRLRMHQVVAQTIHLSIGYSRQTDGGFSRQKKMGRASNLSQDIFSYCLTILHTHDSGMPIRSIPPFPF